MPRGEQMIFKTIFTPFAPFRIGLLLVGMENRFTPMNVCAHIICKSISLRGQEHIDVVSTIYKNKKEEISKR